MPAREFLDTNVLLRIWTQGNPTTGSWSSIRFEAGYQMVCE